MEKKSIEAVMSLFVDRYNRPRKTPLHTSLIQRKLEDKYHPWIVTDILQKLIKENVLQTKPKKTTYAGEVHFYYSSKLIPTFYSEKEIKGKLKRLSKQIDRYSHPKNTDLLGRHLHALVRKELQMHNFLIHSEGNVNSYDGKTWDETGEYLDIIAEHKQKKLTLGLEIKNTLDPIEKDEVLSKIKMCNYLNITPVFACRWLEPYRREMLERGAFPWQFKIQMYPIGQDRFVEEMQKRFGFPISVMTELPIGSVRELENWLFNIN